MWYGSRKEHLLRILITRFPCSDYRLLLASRYRSICIAVKKNFGCIYTWAGDRYYRYRIHFVRISRYLRCRFPKKFEENRSFVTGSGFEKKNSYGSKYWLLCVGGFQNKPVFQRKVFAQHFLYKYEVRLDYMLAYSTYLWLWVEDRRGLD